MAHSYVTYIDEAGDEGFAFERGASRWFVLSAVIFPAEREPESVEKMAAIRALLGRKPRSHLHFRRLSHDQRVAWVDRISRMPIQTCSVLCHKPDLHQREIFRERFRLYFYLARMLLERVSWCCRDDHVKETRPGRGRWSKIFFSNRSSMSYDELREYLRHLRKNDDRIDWNVIRPASVFPYPPEKRAGLQLADAVASSFFKAVEPSRYGHTEDRYANMLLPVVFRKYGRVAGYGVKVWPAEATNLALESWR